MESPREHVVKRQKRRPVACDRCHSHKVKCSGERPCHGCISAKVEADCRYRFRDRNVTVPESSLEKLEAEIRALKAQLASKAPLQEVSTQVHPVVHREDHSTGQTAVEPFPNPLLEVQHGLFSGQASSEPVFVGEAACTAFGDRLLQCVSTDYTDISCNTMPDHVTHPVFDRCMNPTFQLPNRVQATLLVRRVDKFIGSNYHLMLRKSFFEQFDRAYNSQQLPDARWACHLFALLALGELYSNCKTNPDDDRVPGMSWFIISVRLLQDLYEEASLEQVQILILLSHYANALGRVKSSHVYCGIAMRLAIGLGLHRSQSGTSTMDPVHREHRRRVWWTLYLFDRLTSSKLGYPLAIQDYDIDVEPPSMNGLTAAEQEEFSDPMHLMAHVNLAKITGSILNDIYCPPTHCKSTFVSRVHRVLNDLRRWDEELPTELRFHADGPPRNLYTLHMHFHLCIIQTTRPILLHIFRTKYQATRDASNHTQKFSQTTHALAESCVQAARTTNQLLSKLFVEGNLAVFGYFDAHYLFSSTLILIISAVMEPAAAISDAVQTAFNLLTAMASNGNISAKDYLGRLQHIRSTVSNARAEAERRSATAATLQRMSCSGQEEHPTEKLSSHGEAFVDQQNDWNLSATLLGGEDFSGEDPLGNPFIESFLAEKSFEWPGGPSPEQEFLRQFARELEDEFVFAT